MLVVIALLWYAEPYTVQYMLWFRYIQYTIVHTDMFNVVISKCVVYYMFGLLYSVL